MFGIERIRLASVIVLIATFPASAQEDCPSITEACAGGGRELRGEDAAKRLAEIAGWAGNPSCRLAVEGALWTFRPSRA